MENSLPSKIIDRTSSSYKIKKFLRKNLGGWLIMLPGLALFTFFVWKPLFQNIILSFSHTMGMKAVGFAGFENYKSVFQDVFFIDALVNTFKYLFWSIIIGFFIPIILGILLSEVVHFRGFFRLGIYFPSIVSGMAVAIMWSYLFDPNPGAVLNQLLARLGFKYSGFLSNPKLTIPLIILTMTWRGAGATALLYLSSLQNISNSQYEAARIDGANWFNRLRFVTFPHLMPTIKLLFILQVISVFQVFYEPMVMTGGGPNGASVSLLLLSYNYYQQMELSKSAAVAVILSLIIIVLTVIYLRLSNPNKREAKNV